ncbi:class I SAM-dependent methyltransferase [Microbacterium sp.]|uniref:class I SAM-dependent methyltransferase n=1 Tax=Microbacterium sp. TaxID=51671 RepID=UPI003C747E88
MSGAPMETDADGATDGPDAAERLILDESAAARRGVRADELVVIAEECPALALAVAGEFGGDGEVRAVRVHQDALTGEQTLAANAAARGLTGRVRSLPLSPGLVRGARVVLLRLPRSLDALRDVAGLIAAHADPAVAVFAGGRIKHMSLGMNDVLRAFFHRVDVSHARQKSRVLIARSPHDGRDPAPTAARVDVPGLEDVADGVEVRAFGGAFAGARLDLGTRMLLASLLPAAVDAPGGTADDPWIDLACGTGIVAASLALRCPSAHVYATDRSAAAVASARATMLANGVADRVSVVRDDALRSRADAGASLIALNPPFHAGAALTTALATALFADAARVLRPGGQLWCVWNSPLRYRPHLEHLVGPTRQVARGPKFTVTVSTRG